MSEPLGPVRLDSLAEETPPEKAATLVEVRATVSLPKLSVGRVALVDPGDPYIAGCLKRGTLVPTAGGPAPDGTSDIADE